MAGIPMSIQTGFDGRGDTNELRTPPLSPILAAGELSDDSYEYDDDAIIQRMRYDDDAFQYSSTSLATSAPDDGVQTTRPKFPSVQERTEEILKDVKLRIGALSDGMNELRAQTKKLSADFQAEDRKLTELKPLKRSFTKSAKTQLLQLEELNYLDGLISYLQRVEKEMVLLPCKYNSHGEISPQESDSNISVTFGQSLVELGESYREFSSDESATGL